MSRQTGATDGSGTVLVVDDEPHIVGMYAAMLEDAHTVRTATSGREALDRITEDVDVVLLDRRMPDLSGDDVLTTIRSEGHDCHVALVTAVTPDLDIVELPFDAYLVKPVRHQDLLDLVDTLRLRSQYSAGVQEFLRVTSKLVALESEFAPDELGSHAEYRELRDRRDRLETANRQQHAELIERDDPGLVFRDVLEDARHS
jgi:DNA-binding response OmpR family regulator